MRLRPAAVCPIVTVVRKVIANLLALQDLEMGGKRLSPADKETITQLRAQIPEPILAHYDRMRDRDKKAVAVLVPDTDREMPKSMMMAVPSASITTFAGFRSRWTTPA